MFLILEIDFKHEKGAKMKIAEIHGREIYDSRGLPTIACELVLENGVYVTSYVPSGASKGSKEALELRDGGERLLGKGVKQAITNIDNIIAPHFLGENINAIEMDQKLIQLDLTEQKTKLGANTMLAVSMALFKAHAAELDIELYDFIARSLDISEVSLPIPLINVINGGSHAENNLSIQEYLIIPYNVSTFAQAMEAAAEVFYALKSLLKQHGKLTYTGDEGGFAPNFDNDIEPLDFIMQAVAQVGYDSSTIALGLDIAASQMYDKATHQYRLGDRLLTTDQMIMLYEKIVETYPIIYLEDSLEENDWKGWQLLKKKLGSDVRIIGDDLLVTNQSLISKAIQEDVANGAIIKPNQVGTVSEAINSVLLCQENKWAVVASHRSGETCDTFIADLALGVNAHYIKFGGLTHSERLSKYNRLLQIEYLGQVSLLS